MTAPGLVTELASPADLHVVEGILVVGGRPRSELQRHLEHFHVARGREGIVGVVGLELYGSAGLLRSLVVLPGSRRQGVGGRLVACARGHAARHGARDLYLCTEDMERYFARLGFRELPRNAAPRTLDASPLFQEHGGGATLMHCSLDAEPRGSVASSSAREVSVFEAVSSPYRVSYDGSFRVKKAPTEPPKAAPGSKQARKRLEELTDQLDDLQRGLYAGDRTALLLIFQAMDAGGKDSTIRAVLTGVNPAGCQVFSFKKPSTLQLDHDFLWRTASRLPERGRIGVFNRSYYEEVLVVRVHPGILASQRLPEPIDLESIWDERLQSIRDHEAHLARNGTVVLKFWLNVSRDEQRQRFLSRLDDPRKHWKFNAGDVEERQHWKQYMHAYEEALRATSRPHAPWYAIPADDKPFMRMCVADIIVRTLEGLGLRYPDASSEEKARFAEMRKRLEQEP